MKDRKAKCDAIREAARRELFGYLFAPSGSDLLSRRDVDERAHRLDGQYAALEALGTAELTNDKVLARSIALAAIDKGWPGVLAAYRATHLTDARALDILDALDRDEEAALLYGMRYSLLARSV